MAVLVLQNKMLTQLNKKSYTIELYELVTLTSI
jgi:hypothetical protein